MVAPAITPIKIRVPPAAKEGSASTSLSPTSARAPVDAADPDPAFSNWAPWVLAALKGQACPCLPPATPAPALALALFIHTGDDAAAALARVAYLEAAFREAGALGAGGAPALHASLVGDPASADFAALAVAAAAASASDPSTLISLVPRTNAHAPAAPPASVHVAVSVGGLARLSAAPCPPAPAFFAGDEAADEASVAAYRARAGEDAAAFLRERAREASPGGLLLAITPGTLGARSAFDAPLAAVRDAAAAGVASGEVDGCLLKSFAAPLYCFEARELEAAAASTGDWIVLQRGAATLPGPLDALRGGAVTAAEYGAAVAAEASSLLGASLRNALSLTPAAEAALYVRAAALAAGDPARYAHRSVAAAVLLQRRGGAVPRPRTGGRRDWFESRRRSTDV